MENMQYAEELLREFLVFRGFTNTLQVFETELSTDIGRNFRVDKIFELIFSVYVPNYQADKLVSLLKFFKQCFSSTSEALLISTLSKLEVSILRYYVVHALQSGRQDKVVEFFGANGNYLIQRREDWMPWFAIPYLKNPNLDPQFRVYFSKEWFDALLLSFRNFLSELFNGTPALLKTSTEKNTVKRLKNDIKQLNHKLAQLQALLEAKEADIFHLRSMPPAVPESSVFRGNSSMIDPSSETSTKDISSSVATEDLQETGATLSTSQAERILGANDADILASINDSQASSLSESGPFPSLQSARPFAGDGTWDSYRISMEDNISEMMNEEFPEVKIDFQETFLGHTGPITRCRFSASGADIASASKDGTVRIWNYDSSTPTSRNATIYCGSEIMSLDWECRSDRLLLIGTADGGVKAWNVDAKRVVCDLNTTSEFPSVLDLKCSPVEPIFVTAAASKRNGSGAFDKMEYASLSVWNMKTWKLMTVLPLGEDPPAITSLSFNHNGKILAASATDGMIHMFDMSAGLQITGWPAHDSAVCSVLFGPDETSIFSLGSDGKIFEWSLQNQGKVLWTRDCSSVLWLGVEEMKSIPVHEQRRMLFVYGHDPLFCSPESLNICRHEIALDSNGRRLLMTSGSVRSPIYQVQGHMSGLRTLPHSAAITTVDWHPTRSIFLTGSADHSVRVTSTLW